MYQESACPKSSISALILALSLVALALPSHAEAPPFEPLSLPLDESPARASTGSTFDFAVPAAGILSIEALAVDAGPSPRLVLDCQATGEGGVPLHLQPVREVPGWRIVEVSAAASCRLWIAPSVLAEEEADSEVRLSATFEPSADPSGGQWLDLPDAPDNCASGGTVLNALSGTETGLTFLDEGIDPVDCDVFSGTTTNPCVVIINGGGSGGSGGGGSGGGSGSGGSGSGTGGNSTSGASVLGSLFAGQQCSRDARLADGPIGGGQSLAAVLYPGPHTLQLDPLQGYEGRYQVQMQLYRPCAPPTSDTEHDDRLLCASVLEPGEEARGQLRAEALDQDVFTFRLDALSLVAIAHRSGQPLRISLLDERGQVLTADRGAEGTLWLTRALTPGRYFVRVAGNEETEADYGLSLFDLAAP